MKYILFIFLTLVLILCINNEQKYIVNNLSKSQEIVLLSNSEDNISSITIKVSGYIKGDAEIVLMLNGMPYKSERISGDVDFGWGGDWYSDKATINYTTNNVTDGDLVFEYKFKTI